MCSPARNASAWIVIVGWPRPEVTRLLPSQMKRFGTSWLRWYLSTTDVAGSLPMRHVPSRCTERCRLGHRRLRDPERAGGVEDLGAAILQESRVRQIVRMILVGHAYRREAPGVLQLRIERDVVGLDGKRRAVAGDMT